VDKGRLARSDARGDLDQQAPLPDLDSACHTASRLLCRVRHITEPVERDHETQSPLCVERSHADPDKIGDRPSGFTRVLRLGGSRWDGDGHGRWAATRLGDNGERAIWELIVRKDQDEELHASGYGAKAREEREAKRLAKKAGKTPAAK
jgi:hypothetical protein